MWEQFHDGLYDLGFYSNIGDGDDWEQEMHYSEYFFDDRVVSLVDNVQIAQINNSALAVFDTFSLSCGSFLPRNCIPQDVLKSMIKSRYGLREIGSSPNSGQPIHIIDYPRGEFEGQLHPAMFFPKAEDESIVESVVQCARNSDSMFVDFRNGGVECQLSPGIPWEYIKDPSTEKWIALLKEYVTQMNIRDSTHIQRFSQGVDTFEQLLIDNSVTYDRHDPFGFSLIDHCTWDPKHVSEKCGDVYFERRAVFKITSKDEDLIQRIFSDDKSPF